jgi:hypothetical protein
LLRQSGLRPVIVAFDSAAAAKPLLNLPPEESNFTSLQQMQKGFADLETNDIVVFLPKNGTNTVLLSNNPDGSGEQGNPVSLSFGRSYKVTSFSEDRTALRVETARGAAVVNGWLRASDFDREFTMFKMSPPGFNIPGWGFSRMPPPRLAPPTNLRVGP